MFFISYVTLCLIPFVLLVLAVKLSRGQVTYGWLGMMGALALVPFVNIIVALMVTADMICKGAHALLKRASIKNFLQKKVF